MKSAEAFPSKYISAADLGGQEATVKITHVAADEIGGKQKYICYFAGKKKGLVLNKTNWNTIARISGHDDTDDWTGVEVCLYEAMVDFQGDSVPAVRIKAPQRRASVAAGRMTESERTPQPPMQQTRPDLDDLDDFR